MTLQTPSSFAVLGAGAWGTALAMLLAKNGQTVGLWDHDPILLGLLREGCNTRYLPQVTLGAVEIPASLIEALEKAQTIVIVVPSQAFAVLLEKMKPLLRPIIALYGPPRVWSLAVQHY